MTRTHNLAAFPRDVGVRLARLDGALVDCTKHYPLLPSGVTEITRVFFDPVARGNYAGRALLCNGMARVKGDGHSRVVLDSIPLSKAIARFPWLSFTPCAPFYDPDPEVLPWLRFFDFWL